MVDLDEIIQPGLYYAVRESIESAEHLTSGDRGAITACLELASLIERQTRAIDTDAGTSPIKGGVDLKTLNTSYQNLQRYLTDLGLNPQGRRNLGLVDDGDDNDGW